MGSHHTGAMLLPAAVAGSMLPKRLLGMADIVQPELRNSMVTVDSLLAAPQSIPALHKIWRSLRCSAASPFAA